MQVYGAGALIYLPQGYDQDTSKKWPVLFFLIGTGDRGIGGDLVDRSDGGLDLLAGAIPNTRQ